jgi:hypothetical protein
MQSSPASHNFFLLGPIIPLNTLFSNTLNLRSPLSVSELKTQISLGTPFHLILFHRKIFLCCISVTEYRKYDFLVRSIQ